MTVLEDVLSGDAQWHIEQGDSFSLLKSLPDNAVSIIMADPPYDENKQANIKNVYVSRKKGPDGKRSVERVVYQELKFPPIKDYRFVKDMIRVSAGWVLCHCALEQLAHYKKAAGKRQYIRSGTVRRMNSTPQVSGDRPGQASEGLAIMHKTGKKQWNGGGHHADWVVTRDPPPRLHPNQKPMSLMLSLVELFSNPGDIIFDPFCGSARSGVAALRLGRRYIGNEGDPEYVEVARTSLEAEANLSSYAMATRKQLPLFPYDILQTESERKQNMSKVADDILLLVQEMNRKIDALDAKVSALVPAQVAQKAETQAFNRETYRTTPAEDKDLDGPYGNPEIKYDPKGWTGDSQVGTRFSKCNAAYLTFMAEWLESRAIEADQKGWNHNGTPKSKYLLLDAARARGWAKRKQA